MSISQVHIWWLTNMLFQVDWLDEPTMSRCTRVKSTCKQKIYVQKTFYESKKAHYCDVFSDQMKSVW